MRPILITHFFSSTGTRKNRVVVMACLILLTACKKDKSGQPVSDPFENLRIKTITGADAAENWRAEYIYDTQKRVIKETEILWGTQIYKVSDYTYSGNRITKKITEHNSVRYKYYELLPNGYIKADTTSEGAIYTYIYNDKGFLIKIRNDQTPQTETNYYYNTATRLLDSIRTTYGGIWNSTAIFLYDMGRNNSLQNKNTGMAFNADMHIRPVMHYEYKYFEGGSVKTQVTDYLFTYDDKGRITSKSFENAGQRLTYHYTYY